MEKKLLFFLGFSGLIYGESFVKKTGRNRPNNNVSQEEQVRELAGTIEACARLGEVLFQQQQQLILQMKEIVEGGSLYTKDTLKGIQEKREALNLCQQKMQSSHQKIVT